MCASHRAEDGFLKRRPARRGGRARLNAPDSKSGIPLRVSGVRIPPSPPLHACSRRSLVARSGIISTPALTDPSTPLRISPQGSRRFAPHALKTAQVRIPPSPPLRAADARVTLTQTSCLTPYARGPSSAAADSGFRHGTVVDDARIGTETAEVLKVDLVHVELAPALLQNDLRADGQHIVVVVENHKVVVHAD